MRKAYKKQRGTKDRRPDAAAFRREMEAASGCGGDLPERLTVAVVPACRGAGASFVCGQILRQGLPGGGTPEGLRTLIEMGHPYFYDALNFAQRFKEKMPAFFPGGENPETNMALGYNWYVKRPGEAYAPERLLETAERAPGGLVLLDCSGLADDPFLPRVLDLADRVLLVVDPMPTKLLESRGSILRLQELRPDLQLLVNKFNRGIRNGELTSFLGTGRYLTREMISPERVYRAEYSCELP